MKTALNTQKDKFLVVHLKYVLSVMVLLNQPRTPKLWEIVHENGPKMQKLRVFGRATQTCTKCHGPCKPPRNPKIV
jgi:formamidopyrimidine-DNA glycosylase